MKRIFGKRGRFDWQDACRLCVHHPKHRSFFVDEALELLHPHRRPPAATRRGLEQLYVASRFAVRPVVEAILRHPRLYTGPRMVKPPVVYLAGHAPRDASAESTPRPGPGSRNQAGQQLFYPPNVAGWDDDRWLDTASFLARWNIAGHVLRPAVLETSEKGPLDADKLLERALAFWGTPPLTSTTRRALKSFATRAVADADQRWKKAQYPALIENALRHLIAISPDLQTS